MKMDSIDIIILFITAGICCWGEIEARKIVDKNSVDSLRRRLATRGLKSRAGAWFFGAPAKQNIGAPLVRNFFIGTCSLLTEGYYRPTKNKYQLNIVLKYSEA